MSAIKKLPDGQKTIAVRLSLEQVKALEAKAKKENRTVSDQIRYLISKIK